ncbi:hypothetical protein [Cytophaga aurantiaca]|uniref:hypothetical protein n=1 Tax=Cytophaga aurantiaca TaxID=29530 RepID=UPI0003806D5A|nr:hypothetical protein [Cytophaga aurantiaca]
MKKILLITLVLLGCQSVPVPKEEITKNISAAMNTWDVNRIITYAPQLEYGTMEFMGADRVSEGKDVTREELKKRLDEFGKQNPVESYEHTYEEFKDFSLPFSFGD